MLEDGIVVRVDYVGRTKDYFTKRILDPWGTALRYDYYNSVPGNYSLWFETRRTFPLLISAGPDKEFNTPDDIVSRE